MSFDKQNFARTIQEQQAGIAPQMWPILCPDNGNLVLNQPYEISINPCDSLWLPITYDKSYGINPAQQSGYTQPFMIGPTLAGQNVLDVRLASQNTAFVNGPYPYIITAPVFGLRFNSPNNPWLLWSLGCGWLPRAPWGATGQGLWPVGGSSMMRSITGPISRLWIQYYAFAYMAGEVYPDPPPASFLKNSFPQGGQQIVLMSMAGYSQLSHEQRFEVIDSYTSGAYVSGKVLTSPPAPQTSQLACGGYRTTDLNSADLRVLGVSPYPTAPTTSGTGSSGA